MGVVVVAGEVIVEGAEVLGEAAISLWRAMRAAQAARRAAEVARTLEAARKAAEALHREEVKGCATCPKEAVPCFNTPEGGDPAEMDRQLKQQQDAINDMSPDELLENMSKNRDPVTGNIVRPPGDSGARAEARREAEAQKTRDLTTQYISEGQSPVQAKQNAARDAADWMKGQTALHTPDIVAGGAGAMGGVGDKGINSSIGSQWNTSGNSDGRTRAQILEQEAANAKARGDKKMDVDLERCK